MIWNKLRHLKDFIRFSRVVEYDLKLFVYIIKKGALGMREALPFILKLPSYFHERFFFSKRIHFQREIVHGVLLILKEGIFPFFQFLLSLIIIIQIGDVKHLNVFKIHRFISFVN